MCRTYRPLADLDDQDSDNIMGGWFEQTVNIQFL